MASDHVQIGQKRYRKCIVCDNPMQIEETEMCAPCTFGEAASFEEFDFIEIEGTDATD